MASPKPMNDTPPPGPLSQYWKDRGWVCGDSLVAYAAQCRYQRANDGSRKRRK